MTDPTPQPGADPGMTLHGNLKAYLDGHIFRDSGRSGIGTSRPAPATAPALHDLAYRAHRLHSLIGAMDLTVTVSPPCLPEGASKDAHKARDGLLALLEVIEGESRALAEAVEAVAQAKERAA